IIAAGASDYISKPFHMDELYARIKRVKREKNTFLELKNTNKKLENAIEKTNEMAVRAEMASISKNEFLASMSHEIRTPLNGILGFTDILNETSLNKEQSDYVKTIKLSGESLLALINNILDSSKFDAGQMGLEEIDFDPEVLCYNVCELLRPRIINKPVEIICRIGDSVPSKVCGDPHRFRQVITNLMGNAAKFTETGTIELSLNVEEEKEGFVSLITSVKDTGIGIPSEKTDIIFEPFKQARGSTTREYGGTGLGLSICKKIAGLMNGDIYVESEPHKGSLFHFSAKLRVSEDNDSEKYKQVRIKNKRAIVIDANHTNLGILINILSTNGMHVKAIDNGDNILETIQNITDTEKPFDICIIDINMIGINSYDIAKQIKACSPSISEMPLLAVSSPIPGGAAKCEKAGFNGFLTKPIRTERLLQMVKQLLGKKERDEEYLKSSDRHIMTQHSVREDIKRSIGILLAEDNKVNQQLAKIMLTKAGYSVDIANNGIEAINKFTKNPEAFNLILMDVQMPEMDGLEASMAIRHWENKRNESSDKNGNKQEYNVPIIAVTANALEGDKEKCLNAGMNDYLTKPIKREAVFEVIEKWIFND
ncbi:MAG: response regulator, partial [Desulfobacterales bacterium]|nr:response regulator [Desulfobacterales bacterium]